MHHFKSHVIHTKYDIQIHNEKCEIVTHCRRQDRKKYTHKTYCIVSPWQISKNGSKYWNGASNASFIITRYMRHCLALSLMFLKLSRSGAIVNSTKPCKRNIADKYVSHISKLPIQCIF